MGQDHNEHGLNNREYLAMSWLWKRLSGVAFRFRWFQWHHYPLGRRATLRLSFMLKSLNWP